MQRRAMFLGWASAIALGVLSAPAHGKLSADRTCRIALSGVGPKALAGALKPVDACLQKTAVGSCNVVDGNRVGRALKVLTKKCAQATCTKGLYGGDIALSIAAGIKESLETNGMRLFPALNVGSDKAKKKCLKAIVAGRTKLLKASIGQVSGSDRQNAAECEPFKLSSIQPLNAGAVRAAITKACSGFTGADLGVCADLPECVVTGAQATVRGIAKSVFTAPPECGDGRQEGTEVCDDGNINDTDECTNRCTLAACGDGVVNGSGEQCDDGNITETDTCLANCTLARCGDGIVQAGVEECDDGNTNNGDRCSNLCSINRVACSANGLLVTLAVQTEANALSAFTMDVTFDHLRATLPGQGTDGTDRFAALLPDPELDDFVIVNDELVDLDTGVAADMNEVRVVFAKDFGAANGRGIGQTNFPFATLRFDCSSGAMFLASDFGCSTSKNAISTGAEITPPATCTATVEPAP